MLGMGGACGQPWECFPESKTPCGLQGEASFWVQEVLELSLTCPMQNQATHPSSAPPALSPSNNLWSGIRGTSNSLTECGKER